LETFDVCSPVGGEKIKQHGAAKRLKSLDGATIGELWNGVFKGEVTFPLIRRELAKRFPGIKVIPFTEFPHLHGGDNPKQQIEVARQVAALAREKGCDAVITGNGA
jgi:hypothetical protein